MLKKLLIGIVYWVAQYFKYVGMILLLGTVMGAVIFPIIGGVFSDYTKIYLLKKGAWIGFKYAGVWAGGTALVFCSMKARENFIKKQKELRYE